MPTAPRAAFRVPAVSAPVPGSHPGATVTDPALVRRAVKAVALGNAME
ncbi:hypothetical protein GCM10018793_48830 [Streptomyces sulfonofaciens]|uniref:Uncharacterized protein n=1 Tax=Streptomyces sulfonofaciens TaxID=68272 RepID=A0A919L5R1_9ACTN|nr:hypothetical protein [Streptomyces sulfonofaciens]GHH84444.1 hypothetical protein GCM10018793_48830 [Streptomyces sulfonofaciens]